MKDFAVGDFGAMDIEGAVELIYCLLSCSLSDSSIFRVGFAGVIYILVASQYMNSPVNERYCNRNN